MGQDKVSSGELDGHSMPLRIHVSPNHLGRKFFSERTNNEFPLADRNILPCILPYSDTQN